ncbi:hypothetical protein EVAR_15976_1 [Eumeta japonica]|uniref:Uncharacterized protein n=1 Tax=Eumeta variegata TaxID=151549 RepID=A0A4C1UL50_EUMVA|nr:hypothetical protein EVAR_15976_1 [Eumeta japonica]
MHQAGRGLAWNLEWGLSDHEKKKDTSGRAGKAGKGRKLDVDVYEVWKYNNGLFPIAFPTLGNRDKTRAGGSKREVSERGRDWRKYRYCCPCKFPCKSGSARAKLMAWRSASPHNTFNYLNQCLWFIKWQNEKND